MRVNFVTEFNMIMRYSRNNMLSGRERLLWIALFTIANDRAIYDETSGEYDWPEDFIAVPNNELNLVSTLDKRGIDTVRNSLKQRGLIDFTAGERNKKVPKYKLNYLSVNVGYKTVPNDVPNNDPNHVPNTTPYPKYNNNIRVNTEKNIDPSLKMTDVLKIDDGWRCDLSIRRAVAVRIVEYLNERFPEFRKYDDSVSYETIREALDAGIEPDEIEECAEYSTGDHTLRYPLNHFRQRLYRMIREAKGDPNDLYPAKAVLA